MNTIDEIKIPVTGPRAGDGDTILYLRIRVPKGMEGQPFDRFYPANNRAGANILGAAFKAMLGLTLNPGLGPLNRSCYTIEATYGNWQERADQVKAILADAGFLDYSAIWLCDGREKIFRLLHMGISTEQPAHMDWQTVNAESATERKELVEIQSQNMRMMQSASAMVEWLTRIAPPQKPVTPPPPSENPPQP